MRTSNATNWAVWGQPSIPNLALQVVFMMSAPAQNLRKSCIGKSYNAGQGQAELQFYQLSQRWNTALQVDVPGQAMQFQGISPHAPPLFCHDAQAATSTSDCTAGTTYNHNPSPHDHLEQGCNWSLLLLSSGPYAHISFIRTQENKDEKLMPPRPHSKKEHLIKFIFCDSLWCWRSSLKGRTYTQRGMSNEGRTVLTWMMKGGLIEQLWIILGGEWQPRDTILLPVKQWRHSRMYFYLGFRMPVSIGTDRNCFENPKLCDLPMKYSCLPATGPESYHIKYAPVYAHHSPYTIKLSKRYSCIKIWRLKPRNVSANDSVVFSCSMTERYQKIPTFTGTSSESK